jgi:ElaB/YqjD/DUF883 family membrane-anchored ribosome-binding protein
MADQNDKQNDNLDSNPAADTPPAATTFEPAGDLDGDEVEFESADAGQETDAADNAAGASSASSGGGSADSSASSSSTGASSAASSAAQTLKDSAALLTKNVGERAKGYVEDGKSRAGGALDELAQMMHDAAGTVDEKVGAQYGQYARTAAETVTGFSESLKAKNIDELIADASGFVKKSPAIAIGTAAALGFVLIRLVQSGLNAEPDDQA